MAVTDIGNVLAVSLEARIAKMEREMRRASQVGAREFDKIERRSKLAADRLEANMARAGSAARQAFAGLDRALLGGLAAGGAVGLLAGVRDIARGIAEIGDEAKRAGVSAGAFQEWKHVAEQTRIPIDAMVDALKELNIRADEFATTGKGSAADAFARLGLTSADVQAKLKDPSSLLLELIERTQRLGDTAAGVRVFDELFGGTGGERLVTLLSQSRGEIEETIKQAHALGLVVSDDLIANAAELDRKFNLVVNTVGTALKAAIVDATTALGTFLDGFASLNDKQLSTLEGRMRELGLERVRLENSLIATPRGGRGDTRRARLSEIAEEEKAILAEYERRKVLWTPATPTASALPPTPTTLVATPAAGTTPRDRYAEIVASVREFIAAQQLEQQALSLTAQQAAKLRYEHDLLNQATRAGIELSPSQRAAIAQLAADMAAVEAATRSLTEAQDANAEASQFMREGLSGAFTDVITGAATAENAVRGLLNQLVKVVLQAAILGSGPLGGMTGGVGLFSGLKLASGGEVRGPGTGTSDSVPALLSNGEHVIKAAEARKHRALLEAINSGRLGRFAAGGIVGSDLGVVSRQSPASLGGIAISTPISVVIEGGGSTEEANLDLANKTAQALDGKIRQVIAEEIVKGHRAGNVFRR